jgi:predicted nucleic-acid-binding protein
MFGDAMRAVDTNVLVRLLTRDDAKQAAAADAFVQHGAWVSVLALAEAMWVLAAVYERDAAQVALAVEMLLNHQQLALQEAEAVAAALDTFRRRPTLGFSDCLLVELARKAGHLPLGTFDRDLAKVDGTTKL